MSGNTGRALIDPAPLISPEQAELDRQAFMAAADEWRRERNRKRFAAASKPEPKPKPEISEAQAALEARLEDARTLRDLGYSDCYICEAVHIARQTLVEHLGRPKRKSTQKLPEVERAKKQAKARDLRKRGMNYAQIAEAVKGVSRQAVRNWFVSGELAA